MQINSENNCFQLPVWILSYISRLAWEHILYQLFIPFDQIIIFFLELVWTDIT